IEDPTLREPRQPRAPLCVAEQDRSSGRRVFHRAADLCRLVADRHSYLGRDRVDARARRARLAQLRGVPAHRHGARMPRPRARNLLRVHVSRKSGDRELDSPARRLGDASVPVGVLACGGRAALSDRADRANAVADRPRQPRRKPWRPPRRRRWLTVLPPAAEHVGTLPSPGNRGPSPFLGTGLCSRGGHSREIGVRPLFSEFLAGPPGNWGQSLFLRKGSHAPPEGHSSYREDRDMSAALQSNEINVKAHDAFFIDGKWQKPAGSGVLNVISPVTEEVLMTFPEASPKDVDKAVAAAREAFDNGPWPRLSPEERGNYLLKVAELLKARLPELAQAWTTQVGAPISFTRYASGQPSELFEY